MDYLAINIGSSSKKYTFFSGAGERVSVVFTKRHTGTFVAVGGTSPEPCPQGVYDASFVWIVSHVHTTFPHATPPHEWHMGIRIVMPGEYFAHHAVITPLFLETLQEGVERAPVHATPVLDEVSAILKEYPDAYLYACSDSAFHETLPPVAYTYALPSEVRKETGVRRFGYHGLSLASLVHTLNGLDLPERTVVCHLGSGASVTALKRGASIETSMGYSPLEGIPMSTRIGDIGAGAVLELLRTRSRENIADMLHASCGLRALSGYTNDMETLVRDADNPDAQCAIDAFVYHTVRHVAIGVAALGGIDLLVFSGGMAERSATIRRLVVERLAFLGVTLDANKNETPTIRENIALEGSRARIRIIPPDEEGEMRRIVETIHT